MPRRRLLARELDRTTTWKGIEGTYSYAMLNKMELRKEKKTRMM